MRKCGCLCRPQGALAGAKCGLCFQRSVIFANFAGVMERSSRELLRRYLSFTVVLFIIAFGTSLSIRANLGSSPISCPPYVLSLVPGAWSMGSYVMCMHVLFILAQILLLRKNYQKIQLLQIFVSVLFGIYTDLTMWMTSFLQVPSNLSPALGYPLRFVELLAGGAILAYGISLEVRCDVLMLAGEGFPLAISKVVKRDFGKVKMFSDTGLVCVGVVFMLVYFGEWRWEMIGPGTLVSMFYVGFLVRVFSPTLGWFECFLRGKRREERVVETVSAPLPLVITVSREYGSGGHDVGERLAKSLGVPLYDRDLIDKTAAELGYTREFVASNEQNISTAKLWELIFTDKSIPESMNPNRDDAIFVSQSRTIRELAGEGACVIVGRMADWVLRDRPNCLRVFVTSDRATAVRRIMRKDGLSAEDAARKIERVNKGRANHYFQYSGKSWTDARNYDLTVNISLTGTDGAAGMIEKIVHGMGSRAQA